MPRSCINATLLSCLVALLGVLVVLCNRVEMSSGVTAPRLAVIGRGCDPVRAAYAEKHWAPRLGVRMDSATTDEELFRKLQARRFDLFFMVRRSRRGAAASVRH